MVRLGADIATADHCQRTCHLAAVANRFGLGVWTHTIETLWLVVARQLAHPACLTPLFGVGHGRGFAAAGRWGIGKLIIPAKEIGKEIRMGNKDTYKQSWSRDV